MVNVVSGHGEELEKENGRRMNCGVRHCVQVPYHVVIWSDDEMDDDPCSGEVSANGRHETWVVVANHEEASETFLWEVVPWVGAT